MSTTMNIEQLRMELRDADKAVASSAADRLANSVEGHAVLIDALADPTSRHAAALGIHEGRVQEALQPLIQQIIAPENKGRTGTLVFALEALDCSVCLEDIFDIMVSQSHEAHISALSILNEHTSRMDPEIARRLRGKWEAILRDPSMCLGFDDKRQDIEALMARSTPR